MTAGFRGVLIVLLLLAGCAAKRARWDDPGLSDNLVPMQAQAPLDVLTAAAGDDDPSNRGRALGLLIRLSPDPTAWGKRALYDPDGWVQGRAVVALTERAIAGDTASADLLVSFVRRGDDLAEPHARSAAAIRLFQLGRIEAGDTLRAAWRAERRPWRAAPLQLAALIYGDTEAAGPLGLALAQAEINLEPSFLVDLGTSEQASLREPLATGEARVEEEMRLAWATARFLLGDPEGERTLAQAVASDDALRALEALDYLADVDRPEVTKLLGKAKQSSVPIVRTCALVALAARGEVRPEVLVEAALSDDPEARAQAARAVARLARSPSSKDRVQRRVLELTLNDERLHVRLEALRAAAATGDLAPEPLLRANLVDEMLAVRIEAAGALLARAAVPEGA